MKELKYQIKPKCVDGIEPTLTGEGYILPCCWCDTRDSYFREAGFMNEELKLTNVEDPVTEIFNSEVWVDFFEMIQYNSENAPNVCHEMCGINEIVHKKVI